MKAFQKIALPTALIFLLSFVIAVIMNLRSNEVMKVWNQAEAINYDNDRYSLAVIRASRNWSTLGLDWRYDIFVGRTASVGEYGHFASFSFRGIEDIHRELEKVRVIWTQDGVTFEDVLGRKLFIPSSVFTGGR